MIDPITTAGNYTSESVRTSPEEMGKDEFLQLLVAQLRHQDPLDPMKDANFIAQMAQFTSLEQLINMNENMTNAMDLDYMTSQSIANSMATSLLGKTVTADSSILQVTEGTDTQINYNLVGSASEVKISIYNEDGVIVNVLYDENAQGGMNELIWDGKASDGTSLPDGHYSVAIEATASDGSPVSAKPFLVGEVQKVQYMDGAAYLMIGDTMIMLGDVIEVSE